VVVVISGPELNRESLQLREMVQTMNIFQGLTE